MRLRLIYEEKQLNPDFWDNNQDISEDIRNQLLEIAKDFADKYDIPDGAIDDITLTGSLANYNWTEYSDVDLHIIVDFSKIDGGSIVNDYYKAAKSLWNNDHEIEICGHEVEIYVQDKDEEHHSSAVYSIQNGKWIIEPTESTKIKPNKSEISEKAQSIINRINEIEQLVSSNSENAYEESTELKDRIKKMRKAGLSSGGEFSLENLAFKELRNKGYLDKLSQISRRAYDLTKSVDKCETSK